ncbi:hypothetical protein CLV28_0927 [Sediminihabitans luteus]|uniref:Uncharacterized protein n=1 Tax=Sediminihabitans luteus TaxID=1138585 RepID=A0A2M9D0I0_9CELL|nr:hypothetical protein [Sediminihabitans luteus]PJJ77701.1 hypothetical protein CLV28_0927 [Sediminihabitans luteus]GIJ00072.1 hypothetical protein Slu03_24490 [Sediminihabitans luteus]
MVEISGGLPAAYAHDHVLVVPAGATPLDGFARAWFPDATWSREPVSAEEAGRRAPRSTGARFRGLSVQVAAEPGELALTPGWTVVGPFATEAGRVAGFEVPTDTWVLHAEATVERGAPAQGGPDRDGIARAFPAGHPVGAELQVLRWAVAVARVVGGAVLPDTRAVLRPDPQGAVDLTVYGPLVLTSGEMLPLLRKAVTGARIVSEGTDARGAAYASLVGESAYDGSLHLTMQRVDSVPNALAALDWRDYGPFAYAVAWRPTDGYELDLEDPSGTHLIARARMRAAAARLAESLQRRVGGAVVDDGGFLTPVPGLRARGADESHGRLWG